MTDHIVLVFDPSSLYLSPQAKKGMFPHLPNRIQNISILEYSEQFVVCSDFMKVGPLLISKEQIWLPDGV